MADAGIRDPQVYPRGCRRAPGHASRHSGPEGASALPLARRNPLSQIRHNKPGRTLRTAFHLRPTSCDDARTAAAHQACIDRPQAAVHELGNIVDDPSDRIEFWRSPDRCVLRRNDSITIPDDLSQPMRKAIAGVLFDRRPPLPKPSSRGTAAWRRHSRYPLRIPDLPQDVLSNISAAIHQTWTKHADPPLPATASFPAASEPAFPAPQPSSAASSSSFRTTSPTRLANTFSATGAAPISAPTTPSATLTFTARPSSIPHCAILFRNVPCLGAQARNPLARDTFRGMRQNYAGIANEHL